MWKIGGHFGGSERFVLVICISYIRGEFRLGMIWRICLVFGGRSAIQDIVTTINIIGTIKVFLRRHIGHASKIRKKDG